tara:strand:- start:2020 stop:3204 length:1185 start_codon:yes stop_codon:yes gene_type:complete
MNSKIFFFVFFIFAQNTYSQYTETINSNRPGSSEGSFSVGIDVLQFESGLSLRNVMLNKINLFDYELTNKFRYGIISEKLEFNLGTTFNYSEFLNDEDVRPKLKNVNFGFKYLIYDPFKNKKWYGTNIYSWKANRKIKITDFIPAISLSTGIQINNKNYFESINNIGVFNFFLIDKNINTQYSQSEGMDIFKNLILFNEKAISIYFNVITQNHFLGKWVFVNNIYFKTIGMRYFPELIYTGTLTHNFNNPKFSSFVEVSLQKNKLYSSNQLKSGFAYLINKNSQIDINIGSNFLNSLENFYFGLGFSGRIDWHRDIYEIDIQARKEFKRELKERRKEQKNQNKQDRKSSKNIKPKKLEKKENRKSKKELSRSLKQNKKQLKKDEKALKKMNKIG